MAGWRGAFLHAGNSMASALIPGVAVLEDVVNIADHRGPAKHAAAVDLALEALAADRGPLVPGAATDPEFLEGLDLLVHGYAKIINALKRLEPV